MADCKNCEEKQACVPFFVHENVLMHYNRANQRMLVALIAVCVTLLLVILVFVNGYTEREKNRLTTTTQVVEVADAERVPRIPE